MSCCFPLRCFHEKLQHCTAEAVAQEYLMPFLLTVFFFYCTPSVDAVNTCSLIHHTPVDKEITIKPDGSEDFLHTRTLLGSWLNGRVGGWLCWIWRTENRDGCRNILYLFLINCPGGWEVFFCMYCMPLSLFLTQTHTTHSHTCLYLSCQYHNWIREQLQTKCLSENFCNFCNCQSNDHSHSTQWVAIWVASRVRTSPSSSPLFQ